MTGTPPTSEQALALLTTVIADELNAGHFIDERDIPHVARLREVRVAFAALLGRVDALEGTLAEHHRTGLCRECRNPLIPCGSPPPPGTLTIDGVPVLADKYLSAGSPRGEESDGTIADARHEAPSSPDGAPPEETP